MTPIGAKGGDELRESRLGLPETHPPSWDHGPGPPAHSHSWRLGDGNSELTSNQETARSTSRLRRKYHYRDSHAPADGNPIEAGLALAVQFLFRSTRASRGEVDCYWHRHSSKLWRILLSYCERKADQTYAHQRDGDSDAAAESFELSSRESLVSVCHDLEGRTLQHGQLITNLQALSVGRCASQPLRRVSLHAKYVRDLPGPCSAIQEDLFSLDCPNDFICQLERNTYRRVGGGSAFSFPKLTSQLLCMCQNLTYRHVAVRQQATGTNRHIADCADGERSAADGHCEVDAEDAESSKVGEPQPGQQNRHQACSDGKNPLRSVTQLRCRAVEPVGHSSRWLWTLPLALHAGGARRDVRCHYSCWPSVPTSVATITATGRDGRRCRSGTERSAERGRNHRRSPRNRLRGLDMAEKNGWDAKAAVAGGVVTVRELTHSTSAILDELQRQKEPVVITRHGKIIALLAPATGRELFSGLAPRDDELERRKEGVEQSLKSGNFATASKLLGVKPER